MRRPNLQELLVSSSEIADMLGVHRAAVSNWKVRHADTFPAPAYESAKFSLYWREDIEGWAAARAALKHERADALEEQAAKLLAQAAQLRAGS